MRLRRKLQRLRLLKNHFELFGLTPAFALDLEHLDRAYRDIQSKVHPDRYAHAGDAERLASMQMTTQVNEAYRTLKSPLQRARYLLEMNGIDVGSETNTAMPPEFLLQQMELRETLEQALTDRKIDALERIQNDLSNEKHLLEEQIKQAVDADRDLSAASGLVRKLMFLEKFGAEIATAYDRLEMQTPEA